jgi:hypothetical protein
MSSRMNNRLSWNAIGVVLLGSIGFSTAASSKVLATLKDRCSQSVWISPDYNATVANPPGAIFLNRLEANPFTPFSEVMTVTHFGPNHLVRWHCSLTKEQSRCPAGTRAVQGRLGPSRLLQIRCLN